MADLCRNGLHEMTPENTTGGDGYQRCRECRNAKRREQYAADAKYRERAKANAARRYAHIMSTPELYEEEKERNRTRMAEARRDPVKTERMRQLCREHKDRMSSDPEWVARQRALRSVNHMVRYATDPEYRERTLEQRRTSARRCRRATRTAAPPGSTIIIPATLNELRARLGGGQ